MAEERVVRYVITGNPTGAVEAFRRTRQSADEAANSLEKTGKRMKSLGSGMVSAGSMMTKLSIPLIAVGAYSIKSAMTFQSSMTMLRTQAGASAKEVTNLSSAVLKLGPKVAEGPEELAKALYPIRSVGLSGAHALTALTAAAKGSQVSGAGLTEVAEAMSGAMRTQMRDVRSASGAMGIMNGIVGLGKMHLADLTGAMSTGILPAAKNVGLGFRDVGAALDAMTRQGVPAQAEATRMRTNLTKMVAPTGAALRALRSIGLQQFSLAEDMRKPNGLVTALRDLHEHLSRVSKNQQELVIAQAFGGAKGSSNIVGLLNALPEMEAIRGQLNKYGEKQLNQAFGVRSRDASFRMAQALDSVKSATVELGQALIPIVIPAFQTFAKITVGVVHWVGQLPKPLKDVVVGFTAFLAVGGPLLIFFGNVLKATGLLFTGFGKLVTMLPRVGAAMGEAEAATSGGLVALLPEIAAVTAAAAGLLAVYEAVKAIKEFVTGSSNSGHSAATKALSRLHQPSPAGANLHGAIRMLQGRNPSMPEVLAAAPGSRGEVDYLKTHQTRGYGKTKLGGKPAKETAEGKAFRERIAARNEHIEEEHNVTIHNHIHLDGNELASSITKRIRLNPQHAKPVAEGVTRYAQIKTARGG